MVEKSPDYGDNHSNAGALFQISPPAGMSAEKFIDRALALGNNMDSVLKSENLPHVPGLVADCDSEALALFQDLGGSAFQFEQMTLSVRTGTALDRAFTDAGGVSIGLAAGPLAVQVWNTLPFPSKVLSECEAVEICERALAFLVGLVSGPGDPAPIQKSS
jgi:hypothetical protein